MKKIILIFACFLQFANAQTKPSTGEYISVDKSSPGVNLLLNDDKTYQLFVFGGTYEFVNDSVVFNESLESKQKNFYNIKFAKNQSKEKQLKISVKPSLMSGYLNNEYFGIQSKENGEITYRNLYEYLEENESNQDLKDSFYENENIFFSFEIEKPYAVYLAVDITKETKIEKYIIPSDATEMIIENNVSLFDNLKLAGNINDDQSINVVIEKKPMKFVNKKKLAETNIFEKPASKSVEKNWTFPGKKDRFNMFSDSASVEVDTTVAYIDDDNYSNNRFEFKAKIEKNFKEALLNIKKDTTQKYLFVYYNLKDKNAERLFNNLIEEYNTGIGNAMYTEYDASYDNFNFYLATKSDESFFKKNKIKDKSIVILNKDGKVIAISEKRLIDITYNFSYASSYVNDKLKQTENTIILSNLVANKKTDIPELTKKLNTNYKDFSTSPYYYNNLSDDSPAKPAVLDKYYDEDEAAATVMDSTAVAYENNDFKYSTPEISEKVLMEKLNTIFDYYNSKNIVNYELVNILLGEISGNHTNFDLFKNANNSNNKQELKYINYILKYNEDANNKTKIATILSYIIYEKPENNPDAQAYNAIAAGLISYSGNNFGIIQNAVNNFNEKEKASEEANKLIDLYYTTLVNDKPIFENIDAQFSNLTPDLDYAMDWESYKNQINTLFNAQAWDIFETNQTKNFDRAIKWSELSNIVEKNNPHSLDTLGQLYFAVGRKSEAIAIQTKAVTIAKAKKINAEEFEKALNNMKK